MGVEFRGRLILVFSSVSSLVAAVGGTPRDRPSLSMKYAQSNAMDTEVNSYGTSADRLDQERSVCHSSLRRFTFPLWCLPEGGQRRG